MKDKILNIAGLAENRTKNTAPLKITHSNLWRALCFLLPSLLLTVVAVFYSIKTVDESTKRGFASNCDEIAIKISTRLHSHAGLLRSSSALFAATDKVTRQSWKALFKDSKIDRNLPGIQGIGFSLLVPKKDLQEHINTIRSQGFPNYKIYPEGQRDVYSSIIYLEPFSGRNLRAFGYDMLTEPIRKKAMELSRDSDVATLSGKVILVQENNNDIQFGTLMYVPVYQKGMPVNTVDQRRKAIMGWVYSPYRMNDLMNGILGKGDINHFEGINLKLYDDSLSDKCLIYDSRINNPNQIKGKPNQALSFPVVFHGKKWILYFEEYDVPVSYLENKVIVVLVSGILINVFLFLLILTLLNTKKNAQAIAEQLTAELKGNESKLRAILDNSFDAIAVEVDGVWDMCNAATLQLFGCATKEELIGKPFIDTIIPSEQDKIKAYTQNQIDGLSIPSPHISCGVKADGTIFDLEVSISVFIHLNKQHVLFILRDISERRKMENELQEYTLQLKKSNENLENFAYVASHDLKAPLNVVNGILNLIDNGKGMPSDTNDLELIRMAKIAVDQMKVLINDLLEYSRVGNNREDFSNTDLNEVLTYVQVLLKEKITQSSAKIKINPLPVINANKTLITELFMNLLSNALTYHGKNIVEIEVGFSEEKNTFKFYVKDNGIGIREKDFEKIFIIFKRLHSQSEYGGTGIGLALCKRIVEAHQGTIWVESELGKGSTFYFTIKKQD